jgi:hypothetical protein
VNITEQEQPKVTFLKTRKEIKAEIRRLKLRNLLSEAVKKIHYWAKNNPDRPHLVTTVETDGDETLLVGCAFANALFADFGILVEGNCLDPENLKGLQGFSERCAQSLFKRMLASCICDECKAGIERQGAAQ